MKKIHFLRGRVLAIYNFRISSSPVNFIIVFMVFDLLGSLLLEFDGVT